MWIFCECRKSHKNWMFSTRQAFYSEWKKPVLFFRWSHFKLGLCSFRPLALLMRTPIEKKKKQNPKIDQSHISHQEILPHAKKKRFTIKVYMILKWRQMERSVQYIFFSAREFRYDIFYSYTVELTLLKLFTNIEKNLIIFIQTGELGFIKFDFFFFFIYSACIWNSFCESSTENWCIWQALDVTVFVEWSPLEKHIHRNRRTTWQKQYFSV